MIGDDRANAGASGLLLPGPQIHALPLLFLHPKRSPHDTLQTQIKVLISI